MQGDLLRLSSFLSSLLILITHLAVRYTHHSALSPKYLGCSSAIGYVLAVWQFDAVALALQGIEN